MATAARQPQRATRRRRARPPAAARRRSPRLTPTRLIHRRRFLLGATSVLLAFGLTNWLTGLIDIATDARSDFIQLLGIGVFYAVALLILFGLWLLAGAKPPRTTTVRQAIGILIIALFGLGIAGLFSPRWFLADVPLNFTTAGGDIGDVLTSPLGALAMLLYGVTSAVLIAPNLSIRAFRLTRRITAHGLHATRLLSIAIGTPIWNHLRTRSWSRPAFRAFRTAPLADIWQIDNHTTPALDPGDPIPEEPPLLTDEPLPTTDHPERELLDHPPTPPSLTTDDTDPLTQPKRSTTRQSKDGWRLPTLDLLRADQPTAADEDTERHAEVIVQTLASFGVDAAVTQINRGPAVTQYGVEPGWDIKLRQVSIRDERGALVLDDDGIPLQREEEISRTRVRVNKITRLTNDIALSLAATSIRVEAPVPGQSVIGIEVPNQTRSIVSMRSIIESDEFKRALKRGGLPIALGRDVRGIPVVVDLTTMPHLLIAGATGSGKSVCINSIINSVLMHHSPETVRMILIDPKRVELTEYGHIPHLAFSHVVTDPDEVVGVLGVAVAEMERRYRRFESVGARNIAAYNATDRPEGNLPYWVIILDELADLMMAAPVEVEQQVVRLAQLARATGIHLVIATQRPSVDVVTGLIKANFPTRIAFATSSQTDARVILDRAGAEKLLGRGDMLFMSTSNLTPQRLQGTFVADDEITALIDFWTHDRFKDTPRPTLDHLLEAATPQPDSALPALIAAQNAAQQNTDDHDDPTNDDTAATDRETEPATANLGASTDPPIERALSTDALTTARVATKSATPADSKNTIRAATNIAPATVPPPAAAKDSLYDEAVALAEGHTRISSSMIQRRLRVGYPRAVRLIDLLESHGVIAPSDGAQSREVLLDREPVETP